MTSVATGAFVHELQNVTARIAYTVQNAQRVLAEDGTTTDVVSGKLAQIEESVRALAEHTEVLVNVEKFDATRPCRLSEAINRAAALFRPVLTARRITLNGASDFDLLIDVPFSVAYLAIANLINNSIDALSVSGRAGHVTVSAAATEVGIVCRICDDGPGIAPEVVNRLFELSASTKSGGHGLGLYLTRRSLLNHRSNVRLRRSDARGTVFEITFPAGRTLQGEQQHA
jgi:signal transduction histidine kinase